MTDQHHFHSVDANLVETWLKGWSMARDLPAPVKHKGVLLVNVGWPEQEKRYVFPNLTSELRQLAEKITEPWVFLKVCAEARIVKELLPPHWVIQPPAFMMTCEQTMASSKTVLPDGYSLDIDQHTAIPIVRIFSPDHTIAAIGRVVIIDDTAIYDRIETLPDHQRKGLGSIIMKTLETLARDRQVNKGILVATPEGKALYQKLGWKIYCAYTTAVIPGSIHPPDTR